MSVTDPIRYAIIAAAVAVVALFGQAGAAPPTDAAEVFEVKVLEAAANGQDSPAGVLYRMEALSIMSSPSGVQPGEVVTVRSADSGDGVHEPGWIGTAYVIPDPTASGTGRQFVVDPNSDGLVTLPPGPPSATWTR
ncbi:hypothetical protein [Thiocapsa bogorovii]|uniref:hypothetical protein n=1 Tax=Thiocapsa bogorovii TaxID=521689 RepID=UPI001E5BD09B|nr:hypothetical protein [Thiocapsa bogorovii]UHD14738.1 hypothetical protein LT988_15765 [Thiocapsa bogorovii]